MSPKATDDDTSLRRLAGVGWQTRDGRFTIETASGTWSLLDAEQTDDLGLSLVRGPFRSLAEAKAAIEAARTSDPAASPLAERSTAPSKPKTAAKPVAAPAVAAAPKAKKANQPEEPEEPRWITELDASGRRRAHRLLQRLTELGIRDPEGIVRRDLAGDVPAVVRVAVAGQLAAALGDADAATLRTAKRILEVLGEGRDEALDVRWRLVDDAGRPVGVSGDDLAAALKRGSAAQEVPE
jgi:hypothetical protein